MRAKRWLAAAAVLALCVPACPASADVGPQAPPEAALSDLEAPPVEAAPPELEAELPNPDARAEGEQVLAGEALTALTDAAALPEASAAPEATLAPALLNAEAVTLGVGEKFMLKVIPDADGGRVRFKSGNPQVAAVSSTGRITGRKRGGAVVTATLPDGRSAACAVTVKSAPKSISLNADSVTLGYDAQRGVGSTFALTAKLSGDAASLIRFDSRDPAVATVSDSGEVTARGTGTTAVTATTFNGRTASARIVVLNAPERVKLNRASISMFPGEAYRLKVYLPDNTAGGVRFESSDPGVAAVDPETGEVTALERGSAVIRAVTFSGRKAACRVKVGDVPEKITLAKRKIRLGAGETFALGAAALRGDGGTAGGVILYTSGNSAVATVSRRGVVRGLKPGRTTITARLFNGVSAACRVTVKAAPTSVKLVASSPKLTVGERTKLYTALSKGSASALVFSGYDPNVIRVSVAGEVLAVGQGTTRVTVSTYNRHRTACTVRVYGKDQRQTVIIAHRGGMCDWPENSLKAFAHAAGTGADEVELDVRTARDGAQVVHHDAAFTAQGRRYTIENLTLKQIQALDGDICSLDEALKVISATGLGLELELKGSADPAACVNAVSRWHMDRRVCYISFDYARLKQVRALRPKARIGLLFKQTPSNLEQLIAEIGPAVLCQQDCYLTRGNLIRWQSRGLLVGSWTVNDIGQINTQLDLGVDYLTSDDPALAAKLADR